MKRHLLAFATALALGLTAPGAHAALLSHTDLTSTVFEGPDVVRATWVATRTVDFVRIGTYRVERVYAGALTVGAQVEVFDGNVSVDEPAPPDRILVLAPPRPGEPRHLAMSGMRAVRAGRVWRFEQLSNPGLEVPVPQGDGPDDGRSPTRSPPSPVTLERFEALLGDAITRAREVRGVIARWPDDAPARLEALLPPPPAERTDAGYDDLLTAAAIRALLAHGRVDDALARLSRHALDEQLSRHLAGAVPTAGLVARATTAVAPGVRLAAIRLLAPDLAREDAAADAVITLLADSDAAVRAAAVESAAQLGRTSVYGSGAAAFARRRSRVERALVRRHAEERDAELRNQIASALRPELRRTLPMRAGAVAPDGVERRR